MQLAMFSYFGSAILISALFVLYFRNPIYSAMSLLAMFMHIAGL